jgi:hypothetical protein
VKKYVAVTIFSSSQHGDTIVINDSIQAVIYDTDSCELLHFSALSLSLSYSFFFLFSVILSEEVAVAPLAHLHIAI